MPYLIDFKPVRAIPDEQRFTSEQVQTIQAISVNNPEYPHNLPYTCYYDGYPGSYAGYQATGFIGADQTSSFDYPFDQKLGYFGKRQKVTCPDGSSKYRNNALVHVHNRIINGGYTVGTTPAHRISGSTYNVLSEHMFELRNTSLAPNDFTPYLGSLFGEDLFDNTTRQSVKELLLTLETDAFLGALDRTVIADVGGTMVEFMELGGIFSTFYRSISSLASFALNDRVNSVVGIVTLLEKMASFWLQFQYGFKPIWSMIVDYNARMGRRLSSLNGLSTTIQRSSKSSYDWTQLARVNASVGEQRMVWSGGVVPGKPLCTFDRTTEGGWTATKVDVLGKPTLDYSYGVVGDGNFTYSYTKELKTRVTGEWMIGFGPGFILDQYNLMPSLGHVWEVIPFSFVIDWFWKVGDFLSRIKTDDNFVVYGANLCWETIATTKYSTGAELESRLFTRSAAFNPSGTMIVGNGFWTHSGNLYYLPRDIKPGTLVSKFDARFGNAIALLTTLTLALARSRHIAKTTADKQLAARINRLLHQLGE